MVKIAPRKVSFGRTAADTVAVKIVKVKAKKSNREPVLVANIAIDGAGYSIAPATTCIAGVTELAGGDKCLVAIDFTPADPTKGETDTGTLTVTTNAEISKPPGGIVQLEGGGK